MSSYYSSNLYAFLLSLPTEEPWLAEMPLDDMHREAIRLGLIRSSGRSPDAHIRGPRRRPYKLTKEGVELQKYAIEANETR